MTSLLMPSPPISISHRLFQCRYSNSRDVVASSPSFSDPAARVPQRACSQARAGAAVVLTISSIVLCLCTRLPLVVCVNAKHPSPLPLPQLVLPAFQPPSWSQFLLYCIPNPARSVCKNQNGFQLHTAVLHPRSKNAPTPQTNMSLFISNCSLLQF